jgi:hypothetical protein
MLSKELRETSGIVLLGLLAYAYVVAGYVGWQMPMQYGDRSMVPFVTDDFAGNFNVVAVGLCLALGLRQTVAESAHGTWLFLLHRSLGRRQIIGVKLATGLGLYLLCSPLAILGYAWWAASPGKHAGPFFWETTLPVWQTYLSMPALYLGAFLAGIRPGRWFGTRLLPIAGVGVLLVLLSMVPAWWDLGAGAWCMVSLAASSLLDVCLMVLIVFTAEVRDF